MNCQELATAAIEKMDIKMFILNNQHLGMVVQWEDRFYKVCLCVLHSVSCLYSVHTCLCYLHTGRWSFVRVPYSMTVEH